MASEWGLPQGAGQSLEAQRPGDLALNLSLVLCPRAPLLSPGHVPLLCETGEIWPLRSDPQQRSQTVVCSTQNPGPPPRPLQEPTASVTVPVVFRASWLYIRARPQATGRLRGPLLFLPWKLRGRAEP